MALVSILVTGSLTATATTKVPVSSHSRTREAQMLSQACAPAGQTGSTTSCRAMAPLEPGCTTTAGGTGTRGNKQRH